MGNTNTNLSVGASCIAENGVTFNYGAFTSALNGQEAYGIWSQADGASNLNYAVYATVNNSCTASSGCTDYAGYFNGAIGTLQGFFVASDANLKTNVQPIMSATQTLSQLQPKSYDYNKSIYPQMSLPDGNHYGFLAQDFQAVLPGAVKEAKQPAVYNNSGVQTQPEVDYLMINYIEVIPLLVAAINEQQAQILALQSGAKNANPTSPNQLEIKLADKSIVVLEQNQPNPFKENTTINYNIPAYATSAQLLFYNNKGNVISTVEITEKGAGSLLVYGADLTNGVYTYTLLIDGSVIETKKMMKAK